MPKFRVKDTFEIPDRRLFVMAGAIVDNGIQSGMSVRIPLNPALNLTVRVHSIEFARREGGEDVCLCVEADPEVAVILRGLNIADETFEVTVDGTDWLTISGPDRTAQ